MQKGAKTPSYGITVAGIVILTLALVIIFLSIFLPIVRENRIFKERLSLLLYAEYERVLLSDPLLEVEGTVNDRGVETMLLDGEVALLREKLEAVAEAGFSNGENLSKIEGAWDMKLQLRTARGERAILYFAADQLYFYADGTAFCFVPEDMVGYHALYTYLEGLLKN